MKNHFRNLIKLLMASVESVCITLVRYRFIVEGYVDIRKIVVSSLSSRFAYCNLRIYLNNIYQEN